MDIDWGIPVDNDELSTKANELDLEADYLRDKSIRMSMIEMEHTGTAEKITAFVVLAEFLRREATRIRAQRTPVSDNRTVAGSRHLKSVK